MWHCTIDGEKYGPTSEDQFLRWIREGRLNESTLVWRDGMDDWKPLASVPELSPFLNYEPSLTEDDEAYINALYPLPRSNAPYAVASMILGILGIMIYFLGPVLGTIAIVLQSKARRKIMEEPESYTGKGFCTAGLVMGIIGIVLGGLILFLLIMLASMGEF